MIKEAHKNSNSYVLDLPKSWNVFPVFHTSLLAPYHQNEIDGRVQPPPPSVVIDGDKEYEIEAIVDQRKRYGTVQYLVKWVGYPLDEKSDWINKDGLEHAKEILQEYLDKRNNLPAPKRCKK
ncbi:MAG: hypothetical protein EOO61_21125 [Hymenobacter sp.]|nr:MAG: hypothetical protein EOO61_21125 [Hymenobacter sp.]